MNYIKLTDSGVNHLLSLIEYSEREGMYWGNKEQWVKRTEKLKDILKDSMLTLDERYNK